MKKNIDPMKLIEKARESTGVWAILHHGNVVGKIVLTASKSRSYGWNVKMAVVIFCTSMDKNTTLAVAGSSGGCGIDLTSETMSKILRDNAEIFREYGIMVPLDEDDPILNGRSLYEFMFNEWDKLFELGGYKLIKVL